MQLVVQKLRKSQIPGKLLGRDLHLSQALQKPCIFIHYFLINWLITSVTLKHFLRTLMLLGFNLTAAVRASSVTQR